MPFPLSRALVSLQARIGNNVSQALKQAEARTRTVSKIKRLEGSAPLVAPNLQAFNNPSTITVPSKNSTVPNTQQSQAKPRNQNPLRKKENRQNSKNQQPD